MIPKDKALSEIPTAKLRTLLDAPLEQQFGTEAIIERVDAELRKREERIWARGQR